MNNQKDMQGIEARQKIGDYVFENGGVEHCEHGGIAILGEAQYALWERGYLNLCQFCLKPCQKGVDYLVSELKIEPEVYLEVFEKVDKEIPQEDFSEFPIMDNPEFERYLKEEEKKEREEFMKKNGFKN